MIRKLWVMALLGSMFTLSQAWACEGCDDAPDAAVLDKKAEAFKKAADCVRGAADDAAKKACMKDMKAAMGKKKSCCMKKH